MKEMIINLIFLIFGEDNINIIAYYGNKKGRDIDIFLILNDDYDYNCLKIGKLDITYIGLNKVLEMAKNLDPLLTEPVLFGDILYGDVADIKNLINQPNLKVEIASYLFDKSASFLNWAEIYFRNDNLVLACDCLRFSLSFYLYSLHYSSKDKVIDFNSILQIYPKEALLIKKAEIFAKNHQLLKRELVANLMLENEKILTRI